MYTRLALFIVISCLFACQQAPEKKLITSSEYYQEQHRPQFHFSPDSMWMNDPNGMVYLDGEYHLFYQYYPDSTVWGPMHWGHAISTDLVHWEHLPIALYPDSIGLIFSGSVVYDKMNTSGLGSSTNPPLVAIFTYHNMEGERSGKKDFQTQGLAYSLDKGRTWKKYTQNPVLPNPGIRDFRDPKVVWHPGTERWVIALAVFDRVHFYASPNLIDWQFQSEFGAEIGGHGGVWECPDLFPMKLNDEEYWVLLVSLGNGGPNGGSGTQYFVGDFDGKEYRLDAAFAQALGKESAVVPEGEVWEDFEGEDYGKWKTSGEAFGTKPARGNFQGQGEIEGVIGKGLANSFGEGEAKTGSLTSPEFMIEKPYINFLISGGNNAEKTVVQLLVDGKVEKIAIGGNGEKLAWAHWDVNKFKGQNAQIRLVDKHTGGWGHINLDHITFAYEPAYPAYDKAVWLDYGKDNYAGVTWSNAPDGKTLFIGWMSNWQYAQVVPTKPWRSAMTMARELSLVTTPHGPRLRTMPVEQFKSILQEGKTISLTSVKENQPLEFDHVINQALYLVDFEWEQAPRKFGLEFQSDANETLLLEYDPAEQQLVLNRKGLGITDFSPLYNVKQILPCPTEGALDLRIYVDASSIEVFAQDGSCVLTSLYFANQPLSRCQLSVMGGELNTAIIQQFRVEEIWNGL